MKQFEIFGIEFDATSGRYLAICEITDDDDSVRMHAHVFPAETIEWRMAEYDATIEEAIDMVLHEPFVTSEDDVTHPDFLFNAATTAEAKTWHLARCRAHKEEKAPKTAKAAGVRALRAQALARRPDMVLPGDNPYTALREHVQPDPEIIEMMKVQVERTKNQAFIAKNQTRAERMREQLGI